MPDPNPEKATGRTAWNAFIPGLASGVRIIVIRAAVAFPRRDPGQHRVADDRLSEPRA
jgi:hypothetical protein